MSSRPPVVSARTLEDQANYLTMLIARCSMSDGDIAGETHLLLKRSDVEELQALADRLYRIAPHEREIRSLVLRR